MSYKVIIIDNKTNETIVNENNAKVIIGAIANENAIQSLGILECKASEALETLKKVDKVKEGILKEHPRLALPYMLSEMKNLCDLDHTKKD